MGICDSSKNNANEVKPLPNVNGGRQLEVTVNPEIPSNKINKYMAYVSKSLCKIEYENQAASGFLIKLFKGKKDFFCMMTCEHVIKREMIQQRKKISFYYDSIKIKTQEIELDPEKRCIQDFVRLNEIDNNIDINIDATVIEILPEDNISQDYFLSPNENYLNNYDNLTNQDIAIMQYPERDLEYSYGKIKQIDKYQITHTANTKPGSSGSPIFLVNTFKVVGIHQGGNAIKSENYGYCIGPIFNFFRYFSDNKKIMNKNMYNEIEITNNQLNKMTLLYEIKED